MENFSDIIKDFGLSVSRICSERITTGHINDTYKIYSDVGTYILQKINTNVFKNPERVMHNIEYTQTLLKSGMENDDKYIIGRFPEYLKSGNRNYLLKDGFWRIYPYIESIDLSPDCRSLKVFGALLGEFHRYTESADISELFITIPDFHNIEKSISSVLQCSSITAEQADFFKKILEFYNNSKKNLSRLRLVHNDVKWANVLISPETSLPEALIDYDTVMAGYAAFDFGDGVRSACADKRNEFDFDMLESFAAGYFAECSEVSPDEAVLGIISVTAELAARYLRDFLSGNNHFANLSDIEKLERYEKNVRLANSAYNMRKDIADIIFKIKKQS